LKELKKYTTQTRNITSSPASTWSAAPVPRGRAGDALQPVVGDSAKIRLLNFLQRDAMDNSYLRDTVTIHTVTVHTIQDVYEAHINEYRPRRDITLASYWTRAGAQFTTCSHNSVIITMGIKFTEVYFIQFCFLIVHSGSWVAKSVVSGYGLEDRAIEVRSRQRQEIFPLTSVSRPALGSTQPPVQLVPGVLSPGGKARSGRDAGHSPLSSAEVVNERELYFLSPQAPS
jgi:hypothetical protein